MVIKNLKELRELTKELPDETSVRVFSDSMDTYVCFIVDVETEDPVTGKSQRPQLVITSH